MVSKKTATGLQVAGISVAALGVLALVLFLLWPLLKDLRSVSGAAGQVAQDVGAAVTAVSGGASTAVTATAGVAASGFDTTQGSSLAEQSKKPAQAELQQLSLVVRYKRDKNRWPNKRTEVGFQVLANGSPVPYATLIGVPNTAFGRQVLGSKITRTTDARGSADIYWEVRDLPGTDNEDNVTWYARSPGYNDSRSITMA